MADPFVCPWQYGALLTIGFRKWMHVPERIVGPYLTEGMTAMDIGCGMGYFTIPMSKLTGDTGKVIAVDLQPEMLAGALKNAEIAGRANITAHQCKVNSLGAEQWNGSVDFVILFMMLHEVPDTERMIREAYDVLAPGGKLLFAEPVLHVGRKKYEHSLSLFKQTGLNIIATPKIKICRAVVFQK